MNVVEVSIGYGSLTFHKAIEPVAESTETNGNVTIHNSAQPGVPAYYEASFMVSAKLEKDGIELPKFFHWDVLVTGKDKTASYIEVEEEAALQLAPTLRAVADEIDRQIRAPAAAE